MLAGWARLKYPHHIHAAVSNSDTPPLVVQLLVAIYPQSASYPVGGGTEFPLHIAAATPFSDHFFKTRSKPEQHKHSQPVQARKLHSGCIPGYFTTYLAYVAPSFVSVRMNETLQ